MCAMTSLAVFLGMSVSGCPESAHLGFDSATSTNASESMLKDGRRLITITCNQETQLCIRRAEAICNANFDYVDAPNKRPRVQAFVDGKIVTVATDDPSVIRVVCR